LPKQSKSKRQGLLVGGLTGLGGASQDLPAARKPFKAGQRLPSLSSIKLQGGKKARPIQLSRSRFCFWSADILSASVRSTLAIFGQVARSLRAQADRMSAIRDPVRYRSRY